MTEKKTENTEDCIEKNSTNDRLENTNKTTTTLTIPQEEKQKRNTDREKTK